VTRNCHETPLAVYIHWPFCKSKCPYCDFNSHVSANIEQEKWLAAYLREIDYFLPQLEARKITSIFFGGGTPSLMPPSTAQKIIEKIKHGWVHDADIEITLEANPTSVEAEKMRDFKAAGINRISMGIQALNDNDLKFLGREHSSKEALAALEKVKKHFDNFSFDLIYARPGQTLESWEKELSQALELAGNHLSLYQLTIEKGTPFYAAYKTGGFILPDEEMAADLYQLTNELCAEKGLPAYEISNYCRPGYESKHNLAYWRYQEYLGVGPGAHSRLAPSPTAREHMMMIHNPSGWLDSVSANGHGIQQRSELEDQEVLEEFIMMGLRIKDGIGREKFSTLLNRQPEEIFLESTLEFLRKENYIELDSTGLRTTEKGFPVLNSVTAKLLSGITNQAVI